MTSFLKIAGFFFLFSPHLFAESSVWRVEAGKKYIYVGGTVHILRESDYPLPGEFDFAFEDSDVLVLEVNPDELIQQEIIEYIKAQGSYTDGRTLKSVLSPEVYKEFRDYCTKNGISVIGLGKFKPAIIMSTLMSLKLQKSKHVKGVDNYYFEKNKLAGKETKSLESHEFQLNLIVSMGEGYESEFIHQTLKEMSDLEENLDQIIQSWRNGDIESLYNFHVKDMEKENPELYKKLLLDRNVNWLTKIDEYLVTDEKEFILVGDAHLAGPNGLLEQLVKKGYQVSKVKVVQKKK